MSKSDARILGYNAFYDQLRIHTKDRTITVDGETAARILAETVGGEQHDAYAEIADLKRQLGRAKAMQYRLFKLVPAEALILLAKEYPEKIL